MIQLKVNGAGRQFDGDPDMPLLWFLRDVADLTGTKYGCGIGMCGACTVHVDGAAVRSCQTKMSDAAGQSPPPHHRPRAKGHNHLARARRATDRPATAP